MRLLGAGPLLFAVSLSAQVAPDAAKCRIEGTVLNAATGQPLRKTHLKLTVPNNDEPVATVSSDIQGKFAFAGVEPGVYDLAAERQGFITQHYGARKPGQHGEALTLSPGDAKAAVDIKLTPFGSVMGRIVDEDGDPVRGVQISLLEYRYSHSGKQLIERQDSQTDPSGEYRIFDVAPGKYYLRARPPSLPNHPDEAFGMVYYPSSANPLGAARIELSPGLALRGLDLTVHRLPAAAIRGHVVLPAGSADLSVSLAVEEDGHGENKDARISRKDSKFEFLGIPVGSYILTAGYNAGGKRYTARVPVQMNGANRENVELRPVPPSEILGQIQIKGESKIKLSEIHVWLSEFGEFSFFVSGSMIVVSSGENGAGAENPPVIVGSSEGNATTENGAFTYRNLDPNVYHVNVKAPDGLYLKSIKWGSQDITESGIDLSAGAISAALQIVVSVNGGGIEGNVNTGESQPAPGAKVTLVPSDSHRTSLFKTAVAGPDGRFMFKDLAPGGYKLFAWDDVDVDAVHYDPDFLKPFEAQGQSVQISEKQKESAHLKLIQTSTGH